MGAVVRGSVLLRFSSPLFCCSRLHRTECVPRHSLGRVLQEEEQWLERQREWEEAGNKGYWDGLDEAGLAPEAVDAEEGDTLSYSEYERRQRLAAFDAQEEAGPDRPPFVPGVQGSGIADSYNSDFAMGGFRAQQQQQQQMPGRPFGPPPPSSMGNEQPVYMGGMDSSARGAGGMTAARWLALLTLGLLARDGFRVARSLRAKL